MAKLQGLRYPLSLCRARLGCQWTHFRSSWGSKESTPGAATHCIGRCADEAMEGCHADDELAPPAMPPYLLDAAREVQQYPTRELPAGLAASTMAGGAGVCPVSCHGGRDVACLCTTAASARRLRGTGAMAGWRLGRCPGSTPGSRRCRRASTVSRFRLRGRCRLCQCTSCSASRFTAQL